MGGDIDIPVNRGKVCSLNMAHIRQSRLDFDLGFQGNAFLTTFAVQPFTCFVQSADQRGALGCPDHGGGYIDFRVIRGKVCTGEGLRVYGSRLPQAVMDQPGHSVRFKPHSLC